MDDFRYTINVKEMATKGTLDSVECDGCELDTPVNIIMKMETDGGWTITAPDKGTFATGSTQEEAFESLVEELEFLAKENNEDTCLDKMNKYA